MQVTAGTVKLVAQSEAAVVQPPFEHVLPLGQSELVLHQLVPAKTGFVLAEHSPLSQMPSPADAEMGDQKSHESPLFAGSPSL